MDGRPGLADPGTRLAGRAIGASLLAAALFEAVTFVSKQTLPVYDHVPWLNDPYDTAVSFALFCIPLLVAPSAVRLLAGRRSEAVPTARLTDLLRAAGISLAVVAATASAEWAAVALGANKPAWNAGTGVQVGLLAAFSAAAAGCAGGIGKASAALRRVSEAGRADWPHGAKTETSDWLGDLLEVAVLGVRWLGPARRPARRLLGWAGRTVLPAIRRRPLLTAAGLGAACAAAITTSQSVNEGYGFGTSLLFFCVVTAGVFAFLAGTGAYLRIVRPDNRGRGTRRLVRATVLASAAVPVAVAFRATLWALAGVDPRHSGLPALWLLLAAAAAITFGLSLAAESLVTGRRLTGGAC
jgi:hypothetical protein